MSKQPIRKGDAPRWVRQRLGANGRWLVWWEPDAASKALGFSRVNLDPERPTWSIREAKRLNQSVAKGSASQTTPRGKTVDALINDYRRSRGFKEKAKATQVGYVADFVVISDKWGAQPISQFTKPIIYAWAETLHEDHGPAYSRKIIASFSVLFSYCELLGWRPPQSNPCFRLSLRGARPRDRAATWAEYDALIATAEDLGWPAMSCAIALATLQAQRQKDIIEAKRDAFRQVNGIWAWELVRSKRQNYGAFPLHDEVWPRVKALLCIAPGDHDRLLIDHATGKPYSGDLFRKRWATIRTGAASKLPSVKSLQFRDLRRTFGVWARAGGGLKEDIGDVLGNSAATNPLLGETYMPPSFETAARAVASVKRPDSKERKTG